MGQITDIHITGGLDTIEVNQVEHMLNTLAEYIGEWAESKGFRETEECVADLESLASAVEEANGDDEAAAVLAGLSPARLREISKHLEMLEVGNKHMLVVTEVAEAQEDLRDNGDDTSDNYARELADIIVRTLDRAAAAQINIGRAFTEVLKKNARREHKHGRHC